MITHTEDPTRSGACKRTDWWHHYATLCGLRFVGGQAEHRITEPEDAPTCPICHLHTLPSPDLADLAVEALCILSARDDTTEIRLAEVRRIGRISG